MREFGDMTLDEFFELCRNYCDKEQYTLQRVEFDFWSNYRPTLMLTRGGQTLKVVTPSRKILEK